MINAFIALYHVPSLSGGTANAQSYRRRVENILENGKSTYEGPGEVERTQSSGGAGAWECGFRPESSGR